MKKAILYLVRLYQLVVRPIILLPTGQTLAPQCRFYPSCSEYAVMAVDQFGAFKGSLLAARRVVKCNPLFEGGIDFPHL